MRGDAEGRCPLCRAVVDRSATIEYEDDLTVVLRPLDSHALIHLLVIPRRHYGSVHELASSSAGIGELFRVADLIVVRRGILTSGYRYVLNSGPATGQSIAHPHLHILGGEQLTPHP